MPRSAVVSAPSAHSRSSASDRLGRELRAALTFAFLECVKGVERLAVDTAGEHRVPGLGER